MAKKQFIRHLEFYGYPDQNGYTSSIAGSDVDLSEIIKKNKEQDEKDKVHDDEINGIEEELVELSGTVESMIEVQTEINKAFAEELSGLTLENAEQNENITALSGDVKDALCGVRLLGEEIDDVQESLDELSGKVETLSADTFAGIEEAKHMVNEYSGYADNTFAKKSDVPTHEEIEELLEEYATEEWVVEQGYLTYESGDTRYAKKDTVDALSDMVNNVATDLGSKIYSLSGNLETYKSNNDARMGILETNFATLSGNVTSRVDNVEEDIEALRTKVNRNTEDILSINQVLPTKADKSEVANLDVRIDTLDDKLESKVNVEDFANYKVQVNQNLNNLDDKKADKRDLNAANDRIDATNSRIDEEIANRISGDETLQNNIDTIGNNIVDIRDEAARYESRIEILENGLEQEIADRTQGDIGLIGNETDALDADTIWGAKNFAKNQKRLAVQEAKDNTIQEISNLSTELESQFNSIEQELTAKADKTYVDNKDNELKTDLRTEIASAIQTETNRAEHSETELLRAVRENTRAIADNKTLINHNSGRINTITAWDGEDSANYDDSGNGILDVLHRELHNLMDTLTQKGILP
jgi:hypothetical protein